MSSVQFSGLASGIDSAALIDSVVQSRQIRNDIRKKQISDLQAETDSLRELKTKMVALNDLIDKFRSINGGGVSKRANSTDGSVLSAVASAAAPNASYNITVTSTANTATGSFNRSYGSTTDALSAENGTIDITIGSGANQISISQNVNANTTTMADFVTAFNARPEASGRVAASAVNIGTEDAPDYRLMFTTLESGTAKGSLSISSTTSDMVDTNVSQATNAEFSIAGIGTISRSSNNISDVIPGLTFSLSGPGTTTVSVSNDPDKSFNQAQEFVDAYNDIVKFIRENNTIERIESGNSVSNIYGSLAKARVDDEFLSTFRTNLSSAKSTSGVAVTSLSQMGFVTNRDGSITLREDEFKAAIQSDVIGSSEALTDFANKVAGIDGAIYQYTKFNGQIDISLEANNNQIENISKAIAQLDRQTDKVREGLTLRFASLESTVGRLQSQQSALSGILAGLGG